MQLYTKILIGMLVGSVLGFLVGPNSSLMSPNGLFTSSRDIVAETMEDALADEPVAHPFIGTVRDFRIVDVHEAVDVTVYEVEWKTTVAHLMRLENAEVEGVDELEVGEVLSGFVAESSTTRPYSRLGAQFVSATSWLGDLFLALIKMVVIPLVFLSLLVGVASLGDFRKLGRIGVRTIGYFFATTVVALVIGVGLANIAQPGNVLGEEDRAMMLATYEDDAGTTAESAAEAPSLGEQIVGIVPTNPFRSVVEGDMLQVIFIALILGIALTLMETKRSQPVVDMADRLNDAVIMIVLIAMELAPYGVAALLFKVVGSTGLSVLVALAFYSGIVVAGLLLHVTLTYGMVIHFGAKLSMPSFIKAIRPALLLAFSTSSSSATLPVTKQCVEDNLNVSQPVSSFVLPLGATINMDGTALYQGVAALFIAQIYNMDLTLAEQGTIVVTATLASIGAAGVPGAGMVTLAMVLASISVPTQGVALILGVDRLLDMFRTTTNVVGDAAATAFMARLEGDDLKFLTPEEDAANPDKGLEGRKLKAHQVQLKDDAGDDTES